MRTVCFLFLSLCAVFEDVVTVTTPPDTTTTAQGIEVNGVSCSFEHDEICGYTHGNGSQSYNFTWERDHGSTSTDDTGPRTDHTYGTSRGHYMFTEASSPRVEGEKAGLISPQVPAGPYCLTFWYHMYGEHIGTLNVYTRIGSNLGIPVWSKQGEQGNMWHVQQVTLDVESAWNLEFQGVLGPGIRADIAIDDVTVTTGKCVELACRDIVESPVTCSQLDSQQGGALCQDANNMHLCPLYCNMCDVDGCADSADVAAVCSVPGFCQTAYARGLCKKTCNFCDDSCADSINCNDLIGQDEDYPNKQALCADSLRAVVCEKTCGCPGYPRL